jgi:putative thioredoxin
MDVTTATFESEVIEASKTLPVVVDFWAPWCAPCRALSPVIEKVAAEFAGRVKLVKVDTDENPELSGALNIRSIPSVIAFAEGRPAAQFLGAQPEAQVRAFMASLLPSAAEEALARVEDLLVTNAVDEAERVLDAIDPEPALTQRISALRYRIEILRAGAGAPAEDELAARLESEPNDHEARLALADLLASMARYREAMEALLEIVTRDKSWRDGEARKQLIALFDLAAGDPELIAEYRRKLARALH